MADVVKCPVCGEANAADQEFCQYCQSRLQPLTGPLKGADAPLHPGQLPTKKVTAELEPILPQWLRDARNKARQSVEDETAQFMPPQEPNRMNASEPDLLAGLRSQSRNDDDEEDTPDWLANITGAAPKSKKADADASLLEAHRVELGDRNDFARDTGPLEASTPAWLKNIQDQPDSQENKDELKDWFKESTSGVDLRQDDTLINDSASWQNQPSSNNSALFSDSAPAAESSADAPDWLRQMSAPEDDGNLPAWLDSDAKEQAQDADSSPYGGAGVGALETGSSSADDVPSWLQGVDSKAVSADGTSGNDWLKEHQPKPVEPPLKKHTTPLWLRETENTTPAEEETPIWLANDEATPPPVLFPSEDPFAKKDEQEEEPAFGDIPSWLKAAAPESSIYDESPADAKPSAPPEASSWLSTFQSNEPAASSPFSLDQSEESAPPAFTPDAFESGTGSGDALFTEMPDWLSNASPPSSNINTPGTPSLSDPLSQGELPSWVQAMRPVDTSSARPTPSSSDQTLETRGALSGLQGVLPAVPGYAPTSKPKVYSIKLQATQEQQAHAALLEQILAAEAEPIPITSFSPLRSSSALRWFISFIVLVLTVGVISLHTQLFSLPVGVPVEFNGALQVAQNVPEGSPVLVAVDYQPARSGEMEAAAAPMFDQMMVLRHPNLTFISTNETGGILAEHFLSEPLAERGYQYGSQYINLGYLPGGVMGIRAFVQNPVNTSSFDITLNPAAWSSAPLQGVTSISQFTALIVITDNVETARAWIEQTTSIRQTTPFPLVVISSAQAAPMLQPYYESGQVNGIVSGLYGGAIFEQNNAGRPGIARNYWDGYSLGMLLAMSLILGGGLWSLAMGLRDRSVKGAI